MKSKNLSANKKAINIEKQEAKKGIYDKESAAENKSEKSLKIMKAKPKSKK